MALSPSTHRSSPDPSTNPLTTSGLLTDDWTGERTADSDALFFDWIGRVAAHGVPDVQLSITSCGSFFPLTVFLRLLCCEAIADANGRRNGRQGSFPTIKVPARFGSNLSMVSHGLCVKSGPDTKIGDFMRRDLFSTNSGACDAPTGNTLVRPMHEVSASHAAPKFC